MYSHVRMIASSDRSMGDLLRRWRAARNMTQIELAGEAEVSTRHISFLENGKANPSREMVLILSSVLDMPLRERNAMLHAAGFVPAYRETDLEATEMAQVRRVLDHLLRALEPFGAVVLNGAFDIVLSNAAAQAFTAELLDDPAAVLGDGPPNLLRLLFHPRGMRPYIANWDEVAAHTIARAHREVHLGGANPNLAAVLDQVLEYPDVPRSLRSLDLTQTPELIIPVHFRRGDLDVRTISTITTLGTAQDVTLQELRIESFMPADEESESTLRSRAGV